MKLNFKDNRYELECTYAERLTPKENGFNWDMVNKVWFTANPALALNFKEFATPNTLIELNKLKLATAQSTIATSNLKVPCNPGMAYMSYQIAAVEYFKDKPFGLLADSPGVGKSISALALVNYHNYKKVLIVCPATLKGNWARETNKWLTTKRTISYADDTFADTEIVICGYPKLHKWSTALRSYDWDLIICDESHYLKENKSQRTKEIIGGDQKVKVVDEFGKKSTITVRLKPLKAKQQLWMTGTPILNRPKEIFNCLVQAGIYKKKDFYSFSTRYCAGKRTKFGFDSDGASNLLELNTLLTSQIMMRRLKADVLSELPAKRRRNITVKADGKQLEMLKGHMELAKKSGFKMKVKDNNLFAVMFDKLAAMRKELGISKVDFACDYINELLESEENLVVFAHHHEVLDAIAKSLKVPYSQLDGRTKDKDKQIDSFQAGNTKVFIGGITACGEGITLNAASHIVVIEPTWTPAGLEQVEDRCHRKGQKNAVVIDYVVFEDSLDEYILNLVIGKSDNINTVIDK